MPANSVPPPEVQEDPRVPTAHAFGNRHFPWLNSHHYIGFGPDRPLDAENFARHPAVAEEDLVPDTKEADLHRPSFHLAGPDNFGRHCPDRH